MDHPLSFNQISPSQTTAICTRAQAEQLISYDHHRVTVLGKECVLLIHEWTPIKNHVGPFILTVVFHRAESYPPAPDEIQILINVLKFKIRGQPR